MAAHQSSATERNKKRVVTAARDYIEALDDEADVIAVAGEPTFIDADADEVIDAMPKGQNVRASDLYATYQRVALRNGRTPGSQRSFGMHLRRRGLVDVRDSRGHIWRRD